MDNSDEYTFVVDDQFLVGDSLMVAPILEENAIQRDIYLPVGKWLADDGAIFSGPTLLRNISVPIERIPYFLLI